MIPSGKEDFAETLNFYISDSENGISRVPRQKLVEIQQELRRLAALSVPTPGTGGTEVGGIPFDLVEKVENRIAYRIALGSTPRAIAEDVLQIVAELSSPPQGEMDGWQDMSSAPKDGTKFDAWCITPEGYLGVRFTDVCMRGDGSGWGFVHHYPDEDGAVHAHWEYLELNGIFPAWRPVAWRPLPASPQGVR